MAEKNIVPNLEAKATDGNPIFTPRQWLERFRQFCNWEHKIDIAPLLKATERRRYNGHRVDRKRTIILGRFSVGRGTGSTLPNN